MDETETRIAIYILAVMLIAAAARLFHLTGPDARLLMVTFLILGPAIWAGYKLPGWIRAARRRITSRDDVDRRQRWDLLDESDHWGTRTPWQEEIKGREFTFNPATGEWREQVTIVRVRHHGRQTATGNPFVRWLRSSTGSKEAAGAATNQRGRNGAQTEQRIQRQRQGEALDTEWEREAQRILDRQRETPRETADGEWQRGETHPD